MLSTVWCNECLWRLTAGKWTKRLSSTHTRITAQLQSIGQIRSWDFNQSMCFLALQGTSFLAFFKLSYFLDLWKWVQKVAEQCLS